jgi:hypothetical protein
MTQGMVGNGPLKVTYNKCVQLANFIDPRDIPVE